MHPACSWAYHLPQQASNHSSSAMPGPSSARACRLLSASSSQNAPTVSARALRTAGRGQTPFPWDTCGLPSWIPWLPNFGFAVPRAGSRQPHGRSYPLAIVRSPRPGNYQPNVRSSPSRNVLRGQPDERRATRPAARLHTITQAPTARPEPSAQGRAHMNKGTRASRDACTAWGAAHTTRLPVPYRVT